jgi:hypothetical protein
MEESTMPYPNNLFPDETIGAQPTEANPPMPELPPKAPPQPQQAYNPPPPASESLAQPSEAAESSVTRQEEALTIKFAIGKLNDYLLWFLMVLEVTLLIQFFLMLIGADPKNPFAAFMYALTFIPLYPFNDIVSNTPLGKIAAIDWSTLIAMAVYFLVFYALRRFLHILISSPEETVD